MPGILIRVGAKVLAAGIALAALTQLGTKPPLPRSAIAAPARGDRLIASPSAPIILGGMRPGEVRSMLNVAGPLLYGQAVWNDTGIAPGPISVRVDREKQILSVFRGGHEIGTTVILYGAPQKPTPAGRYPVLGKDAYHISKTYGAEMPYSLWLTRDGVAIHASNVRQGAATHGCVGLPKEFARRLFDEVKIGDPVIIV